MKALSWLVSVLLSVYFWKVALKYATKNPGWILPRDFALIVGVLTMFTCLIIITILERLGWYSE